MGKKHERGPHHCNLTHLVLYVASLLYTKWLEAVMQFMNFEYAIKKVLLDVDEIDRHDRAHEDLRQILNTSFA